MFKLGPNYGLFLVNKLGTETVVCCNYGFMLCANLTPFLNHGSSEYKVTQVPKHEKKSKQMIERQALVCLIICGTTPVLLA